MPLSYFYGIYFFVIRGLLLGLCMTWSTLCSVLVVCNPPLPFFLLDFCIAKTTVRWGYFVDFFRFLLVFGEVVGDKCNKSRFAFHLHRNCYIPTADWTPANPRLYIKLIEKIWNGVTLIMKYHCQQIHRLLAENGLFVHDITHHLA